MFVKTFQDSAPGFYIEVRGQAGARRLSIFWQLRESLPPSIPAKTLYILHKLQSKSESHLMKGCA